MVSGSAWRRLRRFTLFVLLVGLVVEFVGVPGLRWTYQEQPGGRIVAADYVSPVGRTRRTASGFGGTCPLIVMVPLKRSLLSYARELLSSGGNDGQA